MTLSNQYPPKFSQNILYPTVYNLKDYDIPSGFDFSPGTYFTVQFPGFSLNQVPKLGFGKHAFDVGVLNYETQYDMYGNAQEGQYPALKDNSRILIEVVDSDETVIFSDVTKIQNDYGFTSYMWIKQDPLRTYENIKQGYGKLRIVAKTNNMDPAYRNRYNVRVELPINIQLYNNNNVYEPNNSPIIFQNSTGSMGSGSGLFMSESIIQEESGDEVFNHSFLHISQSKMLTYSGEVRRLTAYYKIKDLHDEYQILQDLSLLTASKYEQGIHKDFGQGINSLSEIWKVSIGDKIPQQLNTTDVKFKLQFKNPANEPALDYLGSNTFVVSEDFELEYPSEPDRWLEMQGSGITVGVDWTQPINKGTIVLSTGAGNFSFQPHNVMGAPPGGNVQYDSDGVLSGHSNAPGQDEQPLDPPD